MWVLMLSRAFAAPAAGVPLVIQVADDQGEVVSTASVRIENEGMRHRVNHRNGKWRGNAIYPQNEEPRPFRAGEVMHITATAPGYLPRTIKYRFSNFRNTVHIPLEPLHGTPKPTKDGPSVDIAALLSSTRVDCAPQGPTPSVFQPAVQRTLKLDPDTIARLGDLETADPHLTADFSALMLAQGSGEVDTALAWADVAIAEAHTTTGGDYVGLIQDLYRVRALGYHLQWQQWELTRLEHPTKQSREGAEQSRQSAAEVASHWVEWADAARQDTELATALCMAASDSPLECTP